MDNSAFGNQLLEALVAFEPRLSADNGAYRISANNGSKAASLVWPYPLAEVFLEFMEDGEVVLSESVEYYSEEPVAEQVQDIARVLHAFFQNETRVATVGTVLRREELQFLHRGNWVSVLRGVNET